MPTVRAPTAARGYDYEHKALRRAKLAVLVDGTPCRRCNKPMIHPKRCTWGRCFFCSLDLGHATARALGGQGPRELEHTHCNRGAGTRLLNRLKRQRRQHTRAW